jgi:hypothetical protein
MMNAVLDIKGPTFHLRPIPCPTFLVSNMIFDCCRRELPSNSCCRNQRTPLVIVKEKVRLSRHHYNILHFSNNKYISIPNTSEAATPHAYS